MSAASPHVAVRGATPREAVAGAWWLGDQKFSVRRRFRRYREAAMSGASYSRARFRE
jgi:hypothetical protein